MKDKIFFLINFSSIHYFFLFKIVGSSMPPDFNRDRVLPILMKIAKDPVPNVRFVVAKTFKILGSSAFSGNTQPIKQL